LNLRPSAVLVGSRMISPPSLRGFLPGRLSDAGPQHAWISHDGPASETLNHIARSPTVIVKGSFGSNSEELRLSVQVRYAADSRKPADRAAFDRHADRSRWRIRCKYWLSLSGDEARETASHGPLSWRGEVSGVARENAQLPRAATAFRTGSLRFGRRDCTVARGDERHTPSDRRQTRRLLPTAVSFATVR
jgi:hypothetical protein